MVQINASLEAVPSLAKRLGDTKYTFSVRVGLRDGVRNRWRDESLQSRGSAMDNLGEK